MSLDNSFDIQTTSSPPSRHHHRLSADRIASIWKRYFQRRFHQISNNNLENRELYVSPVGGKRWRIERLFDSASAPYVQIASGCTSRRSVRCTCTRRLAFGHLGTQMRMRCIFMISAMIFLLAPVPVLGFRCNFDVHYENLDPFGAENKQRTNLSDQAEYRYLASNFESL